MEIESFQLKIQDLPKEVDIRIPDNSTDEEVAQMIEDLKSQVVYNSRFNEDPSDQNLKIEVVSRNGSIVKLKISNF